MNSSEPAKITIVNAPPKQTPINSLVAPGAPVLMNAPTVKMSTIAAPTYMPASIERTK